MRHEILPLDVKTAATGTGVPTMVNRYREKTVQIGGTFVGSLDLEGTIDDVEFEKLITGITAPGLFTITAAVLRIRTNVTAWTSGQATAKIGAFDSRTDGG